MRRTRLIDAAKIGAIGIALVSLLPTAALADKTCNGFINIGYLGAPPVTNIGEKRTVEIHFGAGTIDNGTKLIITSFQHNLDCNADFPLTPDAAGPGLGCVDEGPIMEYEGDGSIISDCPVTWSSNVVGGGSAINKLVFTASPALEIPANTPTLPGFCKIQFDVKVLGTSIDKKTPNEIEELIGYDVAACDNGVLLSGGFQTGSITTPPPLHFSCYEVPRGNMPDVTGISLIDRFGSTTASAIEVKRICAPTNKNNEDPSAVSAPAHLTAFTVVTTGGTFSKPKNVHVANQFGNLEFDVVAPVVLLEPSSKSLVPPPPPPLLGSNVPNFQCYKTTNVTGDKGPTNISVKDQFTNPFGGITLDVDKRGPFRLCVPVNKNGEDPTAPSNPSVLLCYKTQDDRLPFPQKTVFVTNQFGMFQETITQYDELCVPSAILP
jgi:hypothetical protein